MTRNQTIAGRIIQTDPSGVGHAWRTIDATDLYDPVREELEGEIIGGPDEGEIVASNGQRYRWFRAHSVA
jgi:hypothetical protein